MLFQPTNIYPDYRGSLGNGTVDATLPLTVSWQVNGNSAMTAFKITIYQNDAESTQVYTTGKLTDGCPFYGTSWNGEIQFFSYTINNHGLSNGSEYKLVITQYWGNGANDFVTQASASAFITRSAPSLSIQTIPNPLAYRMYTFHADYSQTEGDSLNWIRWQIAYQGHEDEPFRDTQNIYGTAQFQTTYDGFFTGNNYAIRCIIQTGSGVEVYSEWENFSVEFETGVISGSLNATCVAGKGSGAALEWEKIVYIRGNADGPYTIENQIAHIPEGTTITWDKVNGEDMAFDTPWSIIWKGSTVRTRPDLKYSSAYDADFFTVTTDNGVWTLKYSQPEAKFKASYNGLEIGSVEDVLYDGSFTAVLTPDSVYLRAESYTYEDGLCPATDIYPASTLYPIPDERYDYVHKTMAQFALPQGTIQSVQIGGTQLCNYIQVLKGAASQSVIDAVYENNSYVPTFDPETTYLTATFEYGLGGGNLDTLSEDEIIGLSLYRRQGEEGTLEHVADFPLSIQGVTDWSLASQQGPYSWYLFANGANTFVAESVESNVIYPCFWDWIIVEAKKNQLGGFYDIIKEYRFGKNLSSGAISNNNTPSVLQNFTRYPIVQLSPVNYMSGTLTSLIGIIDHVNGNGYYDTLAMRDEIWALSTTRNSLFLKNRKGDFFPIRISGAVTMETMDNTKQQAQTVSIPWVQIGSGEGISIVEQIGEGA